MKVQVNNSKLLQALGHIQSIVEKKTVKSILSNVKLTVQDNQILLYTTDLDIFAKESIPVNASGHITTTVPINIFYDIIRKIGLGKEICLIFTPSNDPNTMLIQSELSEFTLPCSSAEQFPDFEEGEHSCVFDMVSSNLHYLITTIKHAISYDESRYYLSGVFFHVTEDNGVKILRAVATDAHRMAISEIVLPKNGQLLPSIIIPKKTIFELIKLLEDSTDNVSIGISPNKITFQIGDVTLVSKLIDGKFPDYDKAIPYNNTKLLKVSIAEFSKAIGLVTAISTEKTVVVKLKVEKEKIILSVSDKINSSGTIEVPALYTSDRVVISFNAKYIIDILNNLKGKNAHLKLNSSNTAVLIEDSINTNCRFVLMPMQA